MADTGDDAPRAVVVTVSTRAAAGTYRDEAGPELVRLVAELGFVVTGPVVVPDGDGVGSALRAALAAEPDLVLTAGGTGISPTDATPEQTVVLLDREIPGIPETIRSLGVAGGAPAAMLSRGTAGVAGKSVVVNLPGSPRAVREAMAAIGPVLRHAVDQVHGADHG